MMEVKKRLTVSTLLILLSFFVLSPVFAENWEESLLAQRKGDPVVEIEGGPFGHGADWGEAEADWNRRVKPVYDSLGIMWWRWSDPEVDRWFEYDKIAHFVSFSWEYLFLIESDLFKDSEVLWISCISAVLWECKDATSPWEIYGMWGGDGFSYKDLIWSLGGVGISYLMRR